MPEETKVSIDGEFVGTVTEVTFEFEKMKYCTGVRELNEKKLPKKLRNGWP